MEHLDENDINYHFNELRGSELSEELPDERPNEALEVIQLSGGKSIARGTMQVAKFNKQEKDNVTVYLGLIRYPEYEADVLITVNCPAVEVMEVDGAALVKELVESFTILEPSLFLGH